MGTYDVNNTKLEKKHQRTVIISLIGSPQKTNQQFLCTEEKSRPVVQGPHNISSGGCSSDTIRKS